MAELPSCPSELVAFAQGEGVGELAGRAAERADVLAFLGRKRGNAALVGARSPEFADDARAIERQIEILIGDFGGGLHEGAAFTSALLTGDE